MKREDLHPCQPRGQAAPAQHAVPTESASLETAALLLISVGDETIDPMLAANQE